MGVTLDVSAGYVRPQVPEPDRVELVRRFGGPVSNALFDDAVEVYRTAGVDGAIAYRRGLGCAVAIGDPVCAEAEMPRLAEAFRAECRGRDWSVVYTVASERFATWATQQGYASMEFGRELIVDPRTDVLAGHSVQTLRGKVHRAGHAGVVAAEYTAAPGDEALERAMEGAVQRWLRARHGPQIYLAPFSLFAGRRCKRWFYARRGADVVAVLQLVRLDAYDGYLLSQLVSVPEAPPGTTELLGAFGLRKLGAEGCGHATWGPAPLPELGAVSGLSALSERLARAVFRAAGHAFHLEARNDYRRKFPIARTTGAYLLFDPPEVGLRAAIAVLRAYHASAR
jgi:lysylphosphatidylglycerol synthetase-like protein (DUF2156 family)